jgi:hypothetical protein
MDRPTLPQPLQKWAQRQQLLHYEWRKPGLADYDAASDLWRVGDVVLRCVARTEEERYYCGCYEGELESHPVMYWVALPHAMTMQSK